MSSITESIFEGTPILVFPLGGDQFFNAMRVKEIGVGDFVDIFNFEEINFEKTLNQFNSNLNKFEENCKLVSSFNKKIGGEHSSADYIEAFSISPQFFHDSSLKVNFLAKHNLDVAFIFIFSFWFLFYFIFWKLLVQKIFYRKLLKTKKD